MDRTQKIIIALLIVAIVFSVVSTLINFSLLNFQFRPINVQVPSELKQGNPTGNLNLVVEPSTGAVK